MVMGNGQQAKADGSKDPKKDKKNQKGKKDKKEKDCANREMTVSVTAPSDATTGRLLSEGQVLLLETDSVSLTMGNFVFARSTALAAAAAMVTGAISVSYI